jgi:glutamate racemase
MTKIGVFDSGVGGESVAAAIRRALPEVAVITKSDHKHMPYGDKTPQQLLGFVTPLLNNLEEQGCEVIIIACNTVTVTLISQLRERLSVPLIGIEPMLKPAAESTKTGIVAVCATPATLSSRRYAQLKKQYAGSVRVLEPDCSKWARMIEQNELNQQLIELQVNGMCEAGADVIVLGCTHYHWIEGIIKQIAAGRAQVIQPEAAVIQQLKKVLGLPL